MCINAKTRTEKLCSNPEYLKLRDGGQVQHLMQGVREVVEQSHSICLTTRFPRCDRNHNPGGQKDGVDLMIVVENEVKIKQFRTFNCKMN